jgi:CMP-N,N'-diacetyllegionaminic acid synthase
MKNNKSITSITVCRKGSKRVRDKWARKIGNQSLIEKKIYDLKGSSLIDNIIVGTNIQEIKLLCNQIGVSHIFRDEHHCDEAICSANEMIYDMCNKIEKTDIVVWAHCTNPLVRSKTYDKAIETFFKKEKEGYDSLFSAKKTYGHFWNHHGNPINYNPYSEIHTLAKFTSPIYEIDGAIYIQRYESFLSNKNFVGNNPYAFEIDAVEGIDINEEIDLKTANFYYSNQGSL